MRESLHQLTLTLALPIAVTAVWLVRGEPAGAPVPETAIAYRAELPDLPLPGRERLRTPRQVFDWRAPFVIPEDPAPSPRRAALPSQPPPAPVELADEARSQTVAAAPPSPRAEPDLPGAVPLALLPAPSLATAPIAAAPAAASLPRASAPTRLAPTAVPAKLPATLSAQPTAPGSPGSSVARGFVQSFTISSLGKVFTQISLGKSVVGEPAPAALPSASTPPRIAGPAASPGHSRQDDVSTWSRPVSIPDRAWGFANDFPIVNRDLLGIAESPQQPAASPNGHAPISPPGWIENPSIGLSPEPDSYETLFDWVDLPLLSLASAAAPGFSERDSDFSLPAPVFHRSFSWPITLVLIPEPGSALLLGAALVALATARRLRPRA